MNPFHVSFAGITIDRAMVETLAWTLLHFVWQGVLLASALAVLDVLLVRSRPQLRYLAGCFTLLVMLAAPIATFVVTKHDPVRATGSSFSAAPLTALRASRPSGARATRGTPAPRTVAVRARSPQRPIAFVPDLLERLNASRALPWLVGFWALGVALLTLRLLGGWWLVLRLGRSRQNLPIERYQQTLARLMRSMAISRPVRLVQSGLVSVPTAIGWLRPVILLPASTLTGLTPAQIEAVLAHELAHIRRHDYVINLLQSVIETLLFYHPAVWWVSRRIRDERELCCDDLAVRASGDAVTYARALYQLEQQRGAEVRLALAASGGSLVTRIARLLGRPSASHLNASWGLAWALIATLVLIGGAGGAVRVAPRAPIAIARAPRALVAIARAPRTLLAPLAPVVAAIPAVPGVPVTPRALHTAPPASCTNDHAVDAPQACDEPADPATTADLDGVDPDADTDVEQREAPRARVDFTAEEWERLAQVGVSRKYVENLAQAGYPNLSFEELAMLAQHGVSSEYARRMRRMLGDPSVEELVQLADHGVSSKYASAMRRGLGNPSVEDLVRLASAGVSSEYVAGMRKLDLGDLTADDLVRLANSGVTLEWYSSLRWMGYEDITVERAIELRNSGVTPDYAASLRMLNGQPISLEELRMLQNNGVDVEYAATLLRLVRKDLSVEDLIRLQQNGVTVTFVASLNALGYGEISPDDIIMLTQQGVSPEFISALAGAGMARLAPRDLARLQQNGVDGPFVAEVREAGYDKPTVSQLIRWRHSGIPDPPIP